MNDELQNIPMNIPSFRERLAVKPTLYGWSHNPWASPDSADARATRIANDFVRRMTEAMIDMGYMPFTGIEVNIGFNGENPEVVRHHLHAEYRQFQEHTNKKISTFKANSLRSLPVLLRQPRSKQALQKAGKLVQLIKKLCDEKNLSAEEARELGDYLLSLKRYIHPDLERKVTDFISSNGGSQAVAHKLNLNYMSNGEFRGTVHTDGSEIEITTPAQSPMATILRVNAIKRIFYEASYDYGLAYEGSNDHANDPEAEIPSSPAAKRLWEGLKPFDLRFLVYDDYDESGAGGEHFNVSVLRRPSTHFTYYNAKADRNRFAEYNLFGNSDNINFWGWSR